MSSFAYDSLMITFEQFINERLIHGRSYFTREDALKCLGLKPQALSTAITRQIKKRGWQILAMAST
jgi:hypothetical protein